VHYAISPTVGCGLCRVDFVPSGNASEYVQHIRRFPSRTSAELSVLEYNAHAAWSANLQKA
jgi:hypothetical protein